jgi:hypothetical protein
MLSRSEGLKTAMVNIGVAMNLRRGRIRHGRVNDIMVQDAQQG